MVVRTVWEYRVLRVPADGASLRQLNRLGKAGWELASAVGVGELGAVEEVWCFFKRTGRSRGAGSDA